MNQTLFDFIYILDLLGTFAFAVSGALVAIRREFDLFGVIIIAFVTAVGGGVLRDLLLNAHPVNWIGDLNYVWVILSAVVFTFVFRSKINPLSKTLSLFDTVGIGVFTMFGVKKSLDLEMAPLVAVSMGMVSSVMGGVIRDVLTNEIPRIFQKEIYASACLVGGFNFWLLTLFEVDLNVNAVITILLVILIRLLAIRFKLQLPRFQKDIFGK